MGMMFFHFRTTGSVVSSHQTAIVAWAFARQTACRRLGRDGATGIRRIESVAGASVLAYLNERDAVVKQLGDRSQDPPPSMLRW